MSFLQGFQNCLSTFFNCFVFSTCCLQLNCKHGRLCVHVLLGCCAEWNTVEQSYFKGCSLFRVSHPSPYTLMVTGTAEATGEISSVCSVEIWHLSEGCYKEFWVQLLTRVVLQLVVYSWVLVRRQKIDKITGKDVYVCVCKNFVHLLMVEIVSY